MELVKKSAPEHQKGFVASPPVIIGGIIALIVIFFLATGNFKFSAKMTSTDKDKITTSQTTEVETPAPTSTPTPAPSFADFKTFSSNKMNISFEYPEDWLVQESTNNVTIALLKEGSTKNAEAVITAAKGPLEGAKGLQFASVADLQKVNLKKEFNVTEFTIDEPTKIGDKEAYLLGFDGSISGNLLTGRYLTTIDEDNLYALTVVADKDKWSKHSADLQKVLDSFKLLK